MLKFVIIGLICNSVECYWASTSSLVYSTYESCKIEADKLKSHSAMYFQADCLVNPEKIIR